MFVVSVIKTRMQSLEARAQYRNSFHCAYRIFTEEGVRRFWTGTTPRLARLVVRFLFLCPSLCPSRCTRH
jgi:solute carrier family 25 citrate transporter 1